MFSMDRAQEDYVCTLAIWKCGFGADSCHRPGLWWHSAYCRKNSSFSSLLMCIMFFSPTSPFDIEEMLWNWTSLLVWALEDSFFSFLCKYVLALTSFGLTVVEALGFHCLSCAGTLVLHQSSHFLQRCWEVSLIVGTGNPYPKRPLGCQFSLWQKKSE